MGTDVETYNTECGAVEDDLFSFFAVAVDKIARSREGCMWDHTLSVVLVVFRSVSAWTLCAWLLGVICCLKEGMEVGAYS